MCDTFVALSSATSDGSVIFGKNSDREPNEAQALEYYPAQQYSEGEKVRCTYIEIPQANSTYAVLVSRPFWMWGAEIGANEKGVVIGNEAVFTKLPMSKKGGLTGMDLLRLALERAATAEEALETIIHLLSDFGQGGICGYEDKKLTYHNSYIIADPESAWVLETAGPMWAAVKVKDIYSISNGLTIGETFDRSHPDLIDTARQNKWLKKGQTFHFANCYSDWFFTTFSACRARQARSLSLLEQNVGSLDESTAMRILRDHKDDDYRPDSHLLIDRVCCHYADMLPRPSQSTGSLVAHMKKGLNTFWATGTSAPCTGIFKPVWFEGNVLPDIGPVPEGKFNPGSLWWKHEMLHRSILLDYGSRMAAYKNERDILEASFIKEAASLGSASRFEYSQKAFSQAEEETKKWINSVQTTSIQKKPHFIYRHFWKKQNRKSGILASFHP
ncbi:MAG: C69 family dipeptidase [Deltaproteobacteria bacterium]|nr:C69 family dipeptidase [Deltaproteobacteria bacterium]